MPISWNGAAKLLRGGAREARSAAADDEANTKGRRSETGVRAEREPAARHANRPVTGCRIGAAPAGAPARGRNEPGAGAAPF